ncbi:PH domain-containing protein [Embleya sp. AB8]|uniref:PH domain-containing protein n=1 Tax=Embleya sp. AB8 TaxID=3156304 RepID=UPI003C77BA98
MAVIYLAAGLWGVVRACLCGVRISPEGLVRRGMASRREVSWDRIADIGSGTAANATTPSGMPVPTLVDGGTVELRSLAGHA